MLRYEPVDGYRLTPWHGECDRCGKEFRCNVNEAWCSVCANETRTERWERGKESRGSAWR
jgi:ribosomal protein L37E